MKLTGIVAAAAFALSPIMAHAGTVLVDTVNGVNPIGSFGSPYDSVLVGGSFYNPDNLKLSRISLAIGVANNADPGIFNVYLAKDDGSGSGQGHAGKIVGMDSANAVLLGSFNDTAMPRDSSIYQTADQNGIYGPVNLVSVYNVSIPAGWASVNGEYWIVTTNTNDASSYDWYYTAGEGVGVEGQASFTTGPSIPGYFEPGYQAADTAAMAMIVETVPEPASMALLAVGLLGLSRARARKAG